MNNKQTGWLVGIIVVVLVVAGIWYFAGRNDNGGTYTAPVGQNNPAVTSTVPSGSGTNGTTGVAGQPVTNANWNTYRNATSGFAFEYPTAFNGKAVVQTLPFGVTSITINGSKPTNVAHPTALPQVSVAVNTKTASDTVQSDIEKLTNDPSQCNGTYAISTSTVAGQEQALITCNVKSSLGLDPYSILDFYHGTLHFKVTVNNYPSAASVVEQIENTFTFSK